MSNETDLDWLARNVHEWPAGDHQPWCYVYWKGGHRAVSANCITVIQPCVRIEKAEWLARRAELQNKPSWKDAPEWAEWLAQDKSGAWWFFRCHPKAMSDAWDSNDSAYHHSSWVDGEVLGDWRDTLEKRPEQDEFETFTSIEDNQEQDMKQDNGWFERGELPPVGSSVTVVEVDGLGLSDLGREFVGEECKVMAVFTRPELSHSDAVDVVVVMEHGGGCCCFVLEMIRPIRTERDELIDVIKQWDGLVQTDEVLADAILAAGFSMGAK